MVMDLCMCIAGPHDLCHMITHNIAVDIVVLHKVTRSSAELGNKPVFTAV